MRTVIALAALLVLGASAMLTMASPAMDVEPTLIARGTYDPFKVSSNKHDYPLDFRAHAKSAADIVVRMHDYAPGGSTGWHTHPGPVFITVLEGQLTFYEFDDPTCTPVVVSAGGGYVDTGHGHIARNESGVPARDVTVILAPVGEAFRAELDAPGPFCPF